MLNPARRSGEEDNEEPRKQLAHAGVAVIDSNPAVDLTLEKNKHQRGSASDRRGLPG